MKLHSRVWIALGLAASTAMAALENLRILDKDTEFVVTKANGKQITMPPAPRTRAGYR
ncbi:hypothetical protein G3580_17605 [Nitrogeniibacter mangrovi]|uniref:Uncharacterized protein n=1 Tax=Nitrogeniibacter mangrovi TaxID=2016596 RepID=A0A6C1B7D6_9RHOO|nr:hypothetical protein [Nitrogeniibacter mangrovi]QID19273.1 hypothetical protein G3580_17605 [Nitrogeniibacter mangrovi]